MCWLTVNTRQLCVPADWQCALCVLADWQCALCVLADRQCALCVLADRQCVLCVLGSPAMRVVRAGYFYAPDGPDESVLAMCSKPNNSVLITGDTQGVIKVWDIMQFCVTPSDRVCIHTRHLESLFYRA